MILSEMLETIALIETALVGKTSQDLARNDILHLAIQRAIEIISEASRHILNVLAARGFPMFPGVDPRAMGNILRHE